MNVDRRWISVLVFSLALGVVGGALAQDGGGESKKRELVIGKWYPKAEAGVNFTQSAYSDNWYGGDKGSMVWTLIANGTLENQLNQKVNWLNNLKLAFGQTHQQKVDPDGERHWDEPEKSTDLIDFETIFRFTLNLFVDPYASARFESQFQDATDPYGRGIAINPLRFRESAGVAHKFIDTEEKSLLSRFGFTLRQTSRKSFDNPPPDDEKSTERTNDGGIEWVTDYNTKVLNDRVTWTSKLSLYQPLFYDAKDDFESLTDEQLAGAGIDSDVEDFTLALDADWENIFATQITKIISVQLYLRWVYDKYDNSVPVVFNEDGEWTNPAKVRQAVRKSGQFKQTLSIGLTYRFI